ncbi:hypothetical protein KKG58_05105, partial [Patescibacteria group bacterium]|nr:hypothetical protein [Patescibacteria group bacterium]
MTKKISNGVGFKIKSLIFAFFMFLAAILFWGYLSLFFTSVSGVYLLYLALSWLGFLIIFSLLTVLVNNKKIIYLCLILSLSCFFLFFPFSFTQEIITGSYIIGLLLFLVCLIIGTELMFFEKEQRLNVNLRKFWKKGLPWAITGIALIVSLVYYFNPLVNINQEKIEIPTEIFSFILKPASGIIGKMIPFYDPEMTIDETLASGMVLQGQGVKSQDIPSDLINKIDFNNLDEININELLNDPEIKSFLKEQVSEGGIDQSLLTEQRKQLSETLGVELKGNETMEIVLANLVNSKLGEFVGPYSKEISFGIAVALFFVLKLVGKIFALLAIIIAQIIFSILRVFKVIRIEQEMKPGEVIKF